MIPAYFTDLVNILRRNNTTASRDTLNNPVYGAPTTWNTAYTGVKVRILWSDKTLVFEGTGEIIHHSGIMYAPANLTLLSEDRVLTLISPGNPTGIEYVLRTVTPAFLFNGKVDHFECNLEIPI